MTVFQYQGKHIPYTVGQSLLDALLDAGVAIPYGCRAGACQACLLKCEAGDIPPVSQRGLTRGQIAEGLLLGCQCAAEPGLILSEFDARAQRFQALIIDKTLLAESVLRLRLQCRLHWRGGQYVNLWADDQHSRCYSIASVSELDPYLELHVKVYPGGLLSPQLLNEAEAEPGTSLALQGPLGEFCYRDEDPHRDILLLAEGTGLAPQIGIVRDALNRGHRGAIHLGFQGAPALHPYAANQLQPLSDNFENVSWSFLPRGEEGETLQALPPLRGQQVYLCGSAPFVERMQRLCFRHGASRSAIITECFLDFTENE